MKKIPLNRGMEAWVSHEDFEKISKYSWTAKFDGKGNAYAVTTIARKHVRMHRLIASWMYGKLESKQKIDHRDGRKLVNVRENLRIATQSQNCQNRNRSKSKRSAQYKGVYFRPKLKSRPWESLITAFGKRYYLGYFSSAEAAASRYNEEALRLHGDFARLNIISGADVA